MKALAILLVCGGVALIAISVLDLAAILQRYSPDGAVTSELLHDVAIRSRVCGVLMILIAAWSSVAPAAAFHRREAATHERWSWVAAALIAIGMIPRVLLLNAPLHWDEAFTFNEFVSRPPYDFLSRYSHPNNHVFHTTLAWMASLFSEQKWVLRLPAFLAGAGVLAAVYVLTRKLRGENTALIATALAAGVSPLVEYSAQGRGYTMVALATLLLFAIPRERWLLAAIVAALGAWTIPIMLFPFAAYVAWLVLQRTPVKGVANATIATGALTFLLYLPILIVSGPRSITDNGNVQSLPFREFVIAFPRSVASMWEGWMTVLVLAVVVGLARRGEPARIGFAAIAGIAPLLLILRVQPFGRVWLFLLPLALIVAASGVVSERWPRTAVAVVVIAISVALSWNAVRHTNRPDFFEDPAMRDVPAIASLLRTTLPRDASLLAIQPLDAPFAFEFHDSRLVQQRFDSDPAAVQAALQSRPRIWTVVSRGASTSYEKTRLVRTFGSSEVWEVTP